MLGAVYFIQAASGQVKIGCTYGTVEGRLRAIQTAHWERLAILRYLRTDSPHFVESKWHRRFKSARIGGEWYAPTAELMSAIEAIPVKDAVKKTEATRSAMRKSAMRGKGKFRPLPAYLVDADTGGPSPQPRAAHVRSGPFQSSERAAEVRKIKPPSKWRNKWRANMVVQIDDMPPFGPGEFITNTEYQTFEIAETKAIELMSSIHPVAIFFTGLRYLGPVPAGDA